MKSNDLIYRSDVLDLFGHGSSYTSEDAQRMIKELPSADGLEEKKNDSMTIDEVIDLLTETKEWCFSENYGLSKEWYLRYEKCVEKSIRSLKAWKEILYTIDRYIHLHSGYQTKQEEYGKHDGAKYCADVIREYLKEVKE